MQTSLQSFIQENLHADLNQLLLKPAHQFDFDIKEAVLQIECKRKAENKLPHWFENQTIQYHSKLAMEQCSSEEAALYKSNLVEGQLLIDATGGFGVDAYFFAKRVAKVIYIERNKELCLLVKRNFEAFGQSNIKTISTDSTDFFNTNTQKANWIYIDPARRDGNNRKTVLFEDCEPNVRELLPKLLQTAPNLMIKSSPLIDLQYAYQLFSIYLAEIHIVAVNAECKEVLFILKKDNQQSPKIVCINIKKEKVQRFEYAMEDEKNAAIEFSLPQEYIYEPNASVMKAGLFRGIAAAFDLKKLHRHTHLYTSNAIVHHFPGRVFSNLGVYKIDKKEIATRLQEGKANISTRNFPLTPEELKKKLGIKDGGEHYLFACTLIDERKVAILCSKLKP